MRKALGMILAGAVLASAPQALAQEKLTLWFNKGFYPAEDQALNKVIEGFEKKTGVKVELSLYGVEDIITKSISAVESGTPPDGAFGWTYDFRTAGKWAYDGKLEDVSDVIGPYKDKFLPNVVDTAYLMNGKTGKRSYYAVPIYQQTMHAHYWEDMLNEAGYKDADIPQDWHGFWNFWCDKVQPALRKKGKRVYGIGNPSSVEASDTFFSFLSFVNAYDASPVDKNGKLLIDDPKVKAGMANALKDYAAIVSKGCTPPGSLSWKDVDNNVAFQNKTTVMTHNATISIVAKYLDDMNKAKNEQEKAQAKKNYYELIKTVSWPKKPDGKPLPNLFATKVAVVFADGQNKKRAKEFFAYLLQPENLTPYTEGSLGRWFPVMKEAAERPFWTSEDPHRKIVYQQFVKQPTVPFQFVYNYKFTSVNAENVWGRAITRVAKDKISPEQAVDEMFARIKQIVEG
ncbi:MAG TPA: ABC transporter substrate-binding protein [Ferrovibrio sp.]|uniref:ABC transporter substrate-binding protein n=1 Tax=Ferrovibrio sp. TaxID=1917215 RepID=UPI002ED3FA3E